jgi:uncharacterized protein YidB (DUF937 family)
MKKFLMIAVLVAALTAAFATSAFAAGPVAPANPVPGAQAGSGYGYGAGNGYAGNGAHTPGTGLANGQAPGAGMGARRGAPEWAGDNDDAAGILGLTAEQLQAERLAGKSLAQIAASKGIDEDTLIVELLDARKATVNELLSAGKITQAQADYMLSNIATHVKAMVERTNVGRPAFAGQGPTAGTRGGRWNR